MMRRWYVLLLAGALGLSLAGCGGDGTDTPDSAPVVTEAATALPTQSPVRLDLQARYEALREAQAAILAVWENLASGEAVRCGDPLTVPNPASISAAGDADYETLAALLRRAAIETGQAVDLWNAECANPRSEPPPDVIDEGRLAARAAGDALNEAGRALAGSE